MSRICMMLVLIFSVFSVSAQDIDKSKPYDMMKQVADRTFSRLAEEQSLIQDDPNYLKVVVEEELMPYVNDRYAALKLLGPNLKGAKREDVLEFAKAFREYLVTSYAQVLTQYTGQEIQFGPTPVIDDKTTITGIRVTIMDSPRPNINLEFKLRKDKKTGDWKAFDMIAEGISLLSSKQSEWNTKIRREGILSVAEELGALSQVSIQFEGKSGQ
ncbi:toluene tolerance protein [Vibrio sp. 10N.286.49.C2]|uniref:MlaC/ttg2D family ABC transporter substrate-binding protein n=1 Tax=unclassified Vibrio TaxID=2614977 RepID=UPI000C839D26|nr:MULTISPECIES: phospholipid-binding protein MlaC [unclassified Vibrio]PMH34131.1 toluene tolerance protein [Vibrio sp. 10N.286.49.C2]PMH56840.1 toluene tolerance protein [Vibrio sp. 10N.286.49.B1]PMH83162.1 toluene tolerance protein [Vibrio sp. 10N.286.48.B7]